MSPAIAATLVLCAALAPAVVLVRRPRYQALVASLYSVALTLAFAALEAPDVSLSELVVGGMLTPLLLYLALAKLRKLGRA